MTVKKLREILGIVENDDSKVYVGEEEVEFVSINTLYNDEYKAVLETIKIEIDII